MEQVGFFLLLWLIVGFLVSLGIGSMLRGADMRVEKRIKVRRAGDRGVEMPWCEVDQRHGFGRRWTDRPRWRRESSKR